MRYPLHTTNELQTLPYVLEDERRQAVWVHVSSEDDREWALRLIVSHGWQLLEGLPHFFVAAVRPDTAPADRERLVRYIKIEEDEERVLFMARMFGYTAWEVSWYLWAIGLRSSWSVREQ